MSKPSLLFLLNVCMLLAACGPQTRPVPSRGAASTLGSDEGLGAGVDDGSADRVAANGSPTQILANEASGLQWGP